MCESGLFLVLILILSRLFNDLKLLKVRDVIKLSQLNLNFQYLHNFLPYDLSNLFCLNDKLRESKRKHNPLGNHKYTNNLYLKSKVKESKVITQIRQCIM